jgi:hypothetical protein
VQSIEDLFFFHRSIDWTHRCCPMRLFLHTVGDLPGNLPVPTEYYWRSLSQLESNKKQSRTAVDEASLLRSDDAAVSMPWLAIS